MRKLLLMMMLFIAASLALMGCSSHEVKIDESMNGQDAKAAVGDTLVVTLPGNPTTGFTWEAVDLDTAILASAGEAEFKADSEALGASGMVTLKFKAAGAGATTLKLIYHRTFEPDVAPEKTFEVNVTVK